MAEASPLKKKKLPFKPTALRRAAAPKSTPAAEEVDNDRAGDDLALFRRSGEMAATLAADRERQMKKWQKRRDSDRNLSSSNEKRPFEETGDHTSPKSSPLRSRGDAIAGAPQQEEDPFGKDASLGNLATPPPSKRSRTDATSSRERPHRTPVLDLFDAEVAPQESPSTGRTRSNKKGEPSNSSRDFEASPIAPDGGTPSRTPAIILDSDSDPEPEEQRVPEPQASSRDSSIELLGSDPAPGSSQLEEEEFDEYVRKAAAERALKQSASAAVINGLPPTKQSTEILVTSVLPDSRPCKAKVRFDQPLRLLRDSWVAMQLNKGARLTPNEAENALLTFRRQRVYNYSTLQHLGIKPMGNGQVKSDERRKDGLSEDKTQVHLEAWTPEAFRHMEEEAELQRKRENGELSDEEEVEAPEPELEEKLRVLLRARGFDDVGLTVRRVTTVETLVTGFRTQRGIPSNTELSLWFDGEQLEEHETLDDADIDDMDCIEVHLKETS